VRHAARVVAAGFRFHMKTVLHSVAQVTYLVVVPIVYATLGFFIFEAGGGRQTLLWIALGAGLMGIWSSTLVGSGMALQRERWAGTLEILISTPPPFVLVLTGITLATAAAGLYSLVATLVWGALVFDVPFDVEHPLLFALSIPATVLVLGLLGLVLAATFIFYRQTFALTNLLEYPIWLLTGLLVPLSLLPGWAEPLAWLVGPTWGVRAMRESALGGDPLPALAMCVGLGLAYLALGALCLRWFESLARRKATLALT
jgi:ABC-2 type transport system permease protein